jgi:transposase
MKLNRAYSAEFKIDAANIVIQQGYSTREASEATSAGAGAGATAIRRWVLQLKQESEGITPTATAMTPDQKRIQELEARIKKLNGKKTY